MSFSRLLQAFASLAVILSNSFHCEAQNSEIIPKELIEAFADPVHAGTIAFFPQPEVREGYPLIESKDELRIMAVAEEGYVFERWHDGVVDPIRAIESRELAFLGVSWTPSIRHYLARFRRTNDAPVTSSAPFHNLPVIPTSIPSGEFDRGGEGIAYHVTRKRGNQQERGDEGVALIQSRSVSLAAGSWIQYTITNPASGFFDFTLHTPESRSTYTHYDAKNCPVEVENPQYFYFGAGLDLNGRRIATFKGSSGEMRVAMIHLPAGIHRIRILADFGSYDAENGFAPRPDTVQTVIRDKPRRTVGSLVFSTLNISRSEGAHLSPILMATSLPGFRDGDASHAQLRGFHPLGEDANRNLWFFDSENHAVREFLWGGGIRTVAGDGTSATKDGRDMKAAFANVVDIAGTPSSGMVFLESYEDAFYAIRYLSPKGELTTRWKGSRLRVFEPHSSEISYQERLNDLQIASNGVIGLTGSYLYSCGNGGFMGNRYECYTRVNFYTVFDTKLELMNQTTQVSISSRECERKEPPLRQCFLPGAVGCDRTTQGIQTGVYPIWPASVSNVLQRISYPLQYNQSYYQPSADRLILVTRNYSPTGDALELREFRESAAIGITIGMPTGTRDSFISRTSGPVTKGDTITLVPWDLPEFGFLGWDGSIKTTNRSLSFTVVSNMILNPVYGAPFTVSTDGVSVEVEPKADWYPIDSIVKVLVRPMKPGAGCRWSDGSTELQRTIRIGAGPNRFHVQTAPIQHFRIMTTQVPIRSGKTMISVNDAPERDSSLELVELGTNVTLSAIPDPGFEFVQWSDGVTQARRQLKLDKDLILSATFRVPFGHPPVLRIKRFADGRLQLLSDCAEGSKYHILRSDSPDASRWTTWLMSRDTKSLRIPIDHWQTGSFWKAVEAE